MADRILPRSRKALETQILVSGIAGVSLCTLASIFIVAAPMRSRSQFILLLILWGSLLIFWSLGVLLSLKKWDDNAYTLTSDSLLVRKNQLLGTEQDMYRYESILSVAVTQSYFGARSGYGTIRLTIPRLGQPVSLSYVLDPEKQALKIKQVIANQPNTQSLIN